MSENTPVSTDETPPEGNDGHADELSAEDLRKALDKARQDAAKYRTKVRELEPLAAEAQQLKDAGRTETERLTERATAAETRAAELEARSTRLEVAFEKGLTPAQAKRLVGSTREELEADADEILRDFPAQTGTRKPAPDPAQGRPGGKSSSTAELFAAAVDGAFTR